MLKQRDNPIPIVLSVAISIAAVLGQGMPAAAASSVTNHHFDQGQRGVYGGLPRQRRVP